MGRESPSVMAGPSRWWTAVAPRTRISRTWFRAFHPAAKARRLAAIATIDHPRFVDCTTAHRPAALALDLRRCRTPLAGVRRGLGGRTDRDRGKRLAVPLRRRNSDAAD